MEKTLRVLSGDEDGEGHGHSHSHSHSTGVETKSTSANGLKSRKGAKKAAAEPEPEPVESILSPTFLITESDDEDGEDHHIVTDPEEMVSPTDL